MNELNNVTAWIERAEEDFVIAGSALRRKKPLVYPACFHAQQCAEKYLKAVLIAKQLSFPKTHDLLMLSALLNEAGLIIPVQDQELNSLNDYSVQVRYPGENPTVEDAREALRIAKKVRGVVRKLLGVKKP